MTELNKQEAIEAMKQGKKVRHYYFGNHEWMTMKEYMIYFEDGVRVTAHEFWQDRIGEGWETGYSIVEDAKP